MYMTHTHWVSCQRGSLAITAFQFLDTLHRCYTFNYLFSHVLAAWQQKHTETTSFTSAMVFENLLQLDSNRAPPQLTKKTVYYTLSDVLKRVKGSKWLIFQPSLLTHAGWNIEVVDQVSSFFALFVVAAQSKHTSAIWKSSWRYTKNI